MASWDEREVVARLAEALEAAFGPGKPPRVFRAPGRVNLIGEHTDYNDGFVLPMAVGRYVWVAARENSARHLRLFSVDFREEAHVDLARLERDPGRPWANYVAGVAWAFAQEGLPVRGLEAALTGNVPIGSGLSSSAALETASAVALEALAGLDVPPVRRALLCQRAEAEFVGVQCGIMDQFVSSLAVPWSTGRCPSLRRLLWSSPTRGCGGRWPPPPTTSGAGSARRGSGSSGDTSPASGPFGTSPGRPWSAGGRTCPNRSTAAAPTWCRRTSGCWLR
ncbi:MAG: galactokinase [Anaerolineae bacterium]